MKINSMVLGMALVAASQALGTEIPKMAGHRAECSMTIASGKDAGQVLDFQYDFVGPQKFTERAYFRGTFLIRRDGRYSVQNGKLRLAYDSGQTFDRAMVDRENGFILAVNGNQLVCAYRR